MLDLHKHKKQLPDSEAEQTDEGVFLWVHQAQHNTNWTTHKHLDLCLPVQYSALKEATQTQSKQITCVSVRSVTRSGLWL